MNNNWETSFNDTSVRATKKTFYMLFIIVSIASILFGILLAGTVLISIYNKHAKLQWFETTEAEIVEILEREDTHTSGSGKHHFRRTYTVYAPIYEYEVDGTAYEFRSNVYGSTSPRIGDVDTIYYNPEDPEESFFNDSFTFEIVLVCFGIIHMIIWIVIAITFNKKRKAA